MRMSMRTFCLGGMAVFGLLLVRPPEVAAQICVDECQKCGWGAVSWQGIGTEVGEKYSTECPAASTTYCVVCAPESVSSYAGTDVALVTALRTGQVGDYIRLAADLRARLLLSVDQRALVVQGTACDDDAFSSVIFLPTDAVGALLDLGIPSLEDYLETGQEDWRP